MAKITSDTITSSFGATSLFNTNFSAIDTELNDKVLYRNNPTGEANQMENDLDMNSNDILNGGTANVTGLVLNGTSVTATGVSSLPASAITNVPAGNLVATDLQGAVDELQTELDSATSGVATNVTNIASNDTQLARGSNLGKNLIINADFSVWQRGTSTTSNGYGSADRWNSVQSGATFTTSQQTHTLGQTDVPGNPTYYIKHDVTAGNNFTGLNHRIEGVSTAAGQEVTLSFWAKGVNPGGGNFALRIRQNFGTGGSPSSNVDVDVETFTLTSSWQRFTHTFTPASISGKTLGTNGDDYLYLLIGQGSDTATDAWNIDISNVQLEIGDTATDFEIVSPADNLARCQRYYYRHTGDTDGPLAIGSVFTANVGHFIVQLPVTMRANPTLETSGAGDFDFFQAGATITGASGVTLEKGSLSIQEIKATATLTVSDPFIVRVPSGYIAFASEL